MTGHRARRGRGLGWLIVLAAACGPTVRAPTEHGCPRGHREVTVKIGSFSTLEGCEVPGGEVATARWSELAGSTHLAVRASCGGEGVALDVERVVDGGRVIETGRMGEPAYRVEWRDSRPFRVVPLAGPLPMADSQRDGCLAGTCGNGWGRFRDPTTSEVCEGLFVCGKPAGFASCRSSRGSYVGGMLEGKREGHGVETLLDGTVYVGTFANDQRHGAGSMHLVDGTVASGGWALGTLHGRATVTRPDGAVLIADYEQGLEEGHAELLFKGETHALIFERGRLVSHASTAVPRFTLRSVGEARPSAGSEDFLVAILVQERGDGLNAGFSDLHVWKTTAPGGYGVERVREALQFVPLFAVVSADRDGQKALDEQLSQLRSRRTPLDRNMGVSIHGYIRLTPAPHGRLECRAACKSELLWLLGVK